MIPAAACSIRRHMHVPVVVLMFLLLAQLPALAVDYQEEVSTQDYLFEKGLVRNVSPEQNTLTILRKDGHKITFIVNAETEFAGLYKLADLKMRQNVKIWYRPGKDGNIVLKILRPMDLGC